MTAYGNAFDARSVDANLHPNSVYRYQYAPSYNTNNGLFNGIEDDANGGPLSRASTVATESTSTQAFQQPYSAISSSNHIGIAAVVPTIVLGILFVYLLLRRRQIRKRESYSIIGQSTGLRQNGNSRKYSDRLLGSKSKNNGRNLFRHTRRGDILDDEEDDDDPLSRYANYHRLPKSSRINLRRSSMSSPKHPALERVPTFPIRLETMKLLRIVGVRMVAHGVQSLPRRVWISINDEAFVWQSEFKTKLPNNLGASSLLSVRGPVHNIAWGDIKFIDVGKNTESLKKAESVPEKMCWSILTLNGSLDLQAKSQLERDSMVSCMVSMLDEYNDGEDWRAHYYHAYGDPVGDAKKGARPSRVGADGVVSSVMTSFSLMSTDSLPRAIDV
ncbi:unnamed protein product [Cylindrotheca closterium]|uniref:Uncharacterized protein n=1 Tax=Cylindrotheca closterium TaxID=2856 RepID=A0AAD2GFD0_9STRA|nr:unnamed protein product [Cylindrotheca closterium]